MLAVVSAACTPWAPLSSENPRVWWWQVADDGLKSELLLGTWVHSHEEDRGERQVYRRLDFEFPPSRGRMSFTLMKTGEASLDTPGPDDRSRAATGGWELTGSTLTIDAPGLTGRYQVVALSADRLVVIPQEEGGKDGR